VLGMLLGTLAGLGGYFTLGWYTASLLGAAVSMIVVVACTYLFPSDFLWRKLNEQQTKSKSRIDVLP
jgi:hypothetical protein